MTEKNKPVHDDKIVKVITSQGGESISSQIWPSFMDVTKQKERCGRRVLFKRMAALYSNIRMKTVDVLNAK
jgi:hypothetical protein